MITHYLATRGEFLQNPYHYRDARTNGVMDEVFRIVPKEEIYRATGIQFMPINTLYQLFAHRETLQEYSMRLNVCLRFPIFSTIG